MLGVVGYVAVQVSPWPSALFYRALMDRGGRAAHQALERYVPAGVTAQLDERYDPADRDAYLDVFHPAQAEQTNQALPTIVWVHGGGWFSGSKELVSNYLKILAAKGYPTVGVGYTLAPEGNYPTPVRQVNAALAYLGQNAQRLRVDPSRLILAGDSAGAQIAAQLANVISVPSYARAVGVVPAVERSQLRGAILYCGAYELGLVDFNGGFGHFLRTAMWSYSGSKGFLSLPRLDPFSVLRYVTADFPPVFISAGNADPLLKHSRAFAAAAASQGVTVDTLFFPDNYAPGLPHEYQFNLDTDAGRLALDRSVEFLARVAR
ncbi:MAG: alpha/beta hydrolase [Nitrospirota bacterium]